MIWHDIIETTIICHVREDNHLASSECDITEDHVYMTTVMGALYLSAVLVI
jgi:hypothetical protein